MYTEPNLRVLLNELHPVRASWYKIGLELDIPHTELDCFEQKYSDPLDLICEVLKHWLKTSVDPPSTWEAVITALRSPIVNEMSVAAQLESKYCTQVQCMTDESSSPSKAEKSEGIALILLTYSHSGFWTPRGRVSWSMCSPPPKKGHHIKSAQ